MFLRLLIAFGLLGLAGCVTTPDYRYVSSTGGYYYGDNGGGDDGYYANDGYYGSSAGYYAGSGYGVYPATTWGFSPWSRYGGYGGYGSYAGWGLGFANYGPYGFSRGWGGGGYFGSGWGGYGYSPFYASYFPYWYYGSYTHHRDRNRRDLRAVHAEQLRQADYQRGLNRVPHGSAGIRMWAPGRSVERSRTEARFGTRDEAVRQATLQRLPVRDTPRTSPRYFRDTTPVPTTRSRYEMMPRGVPATRDIQARPSRPANMPVRSFNNAPRGMPAPRSAPQPQPRAAPSMPMRSMPRSMPAPQPAVGDSHGHDRESHRESRER